MNKSEYDTTIGETPRNIQYHIRNYAGITQVGIAIKQLYGSFHALQHPSTYTSLNHLCTDRILTLHLIYNKKCDSWGKQL